MLSQSAAKFQNLRASMLAKIATVTEGRKPADDAYDSYLLAVAGGMECQKASHELTIVPSESPTAMKQDVGYGAKATGGLDDLEDIYSGRSGPGNDPHREGGVKKRYVGGKRPDHMLFDSIADEKALAQKPHITCPSCCQRVRCLDGGKEAYPLPNGQIDIDSGSPMIEQIPVLTYTLNPCGCRVNQEWAAAFTVELTSRKAGKEPQAVVDMSLEARAKKQKYLQDGIAKLYSARDKAETPKEKQSLEYNLVIMTDQLMRLVPGAHNQVTPVKFSTEVQKWAEKNKLKLPPSTEEPEIALGPVIPSSYHVPADMGGLVAATIAALTDEEKKHLSAICSTMGVTLTEALTMSKTHAKSTEELKNPPAKPVTMTTVKPPEKFIVSPWIKKRFAEKLIDKADMPDDLMAFLFAGVPETRTLPKGPPPSEDPAKIIEAAKKVAEQLDTYDKIRAQVAFLLPLLKKNFAYLAQLTRCCVVPGKTHYEAEQVVEEIGKNFRDFLDEKAPLSEHSSVLLTSFLANVVFSTTPIKVTHVATPQQYVGGSSVTPVAAPLSESLKEAMSDKAHKKAIEERKEKAREAFHKKMERLPRKIIKLKKEDD